MSKVIKKITKPVSKVLDKIVPNEIKPLLPYAAAFMPYMLPGGGIISGALRSAGANAIGQLSQEGNEGELNALSLLLAGAQGAGTAEGAGDFFGSKVKTGEGLGALDKTKNFMYKGAEKLSNFAGDASETLRNPFEEGVTLKEITAAGSTPFSQASGDVIYGDAVRQKKEFDRNQAREAVEAEMRQRGLDQEYIDAITSSMTAYGYTQADIDAILELRGYATGGRVGYAFGGGIMSAKSDPDFMSMTEVVENVSENQEQEDMAGMGGVMKLFETPYGFDRDSFEDNYIQFLDYKEGGGNLGLHDFTINALGMVQKQTPSAPMKMADGGMMSVLPQGMEMDYREGGMIPMGSKERADDVPARVSKNEFVMTADAVRAAGGGSVNKGAQRMYQLMNNLEARA